MSLAVAFERPRRDLGSDELWRRSLERSRSRREAAQDGVRAPRSIVSEQILDLDAPAEFLRVAASDRDLSDEDVWGLSLACAHAKRRAAQKGVLPQARVASASLVVAAVAALAPAQGIAHPRTTKTRAAQVDVKLLKVGSRGKAVERLQRALGIPADGVFGPKTRAALKRFQKRHGLAPDGVAGPKTLAALGGGATKAKAGAEKRLIRAWWVAPVQRKLGVAVDGVYGPKTRAAVRAHQRRNGLIVDGVVGPQTLRSLGISRSSGTKPRGHSHSHSHAASQGASSGPKSISRTLWDELQLARGMGLRLVSGHRPGATIGGGNPSDHAAYPSRAIDMAGSKSAMRRFALAAAGRSGIRYVIYSPLGMWGNWSGSWRPVSGGTYSSHLDHVHVSAS